jgi:shikimate dehydrogenase
MIKVSGSTKLMGLLSQGMSQTLSPSMHNHAAQLLGKDVVYVNFDLTSDKVASFLELFWDLGGVGLNVTMPHKNIVAPLVSNQSLNSINTLSRGANGWLGHSTDGEGFLRGLTRSNASIQDFDMVILLGTGGAAQAVISAICSSTLDRTLPIIIHRRTRARDHLMHESIREPSCQWMTFRDFSASSFFDTMKCSAGARRLIIQATSAPKKGDTLIDLTPGLDFMTHSDLLVDLIYDKPSDLYFSAIARDLRCQDGLPMLIEQARLSQQIWWGKAASYDEMLHGIKKSGWRS